MKWCARSRVFPLECKSTWIGYGSLRPICTWLFPGATPTSQSEMERTLAQATWPESYIRIVVSRGTDAIIGLQPEPETQPIF